MSKQVEQAMPSGHKKQEDEWFARNEREMLKNLKRERERKQKELEESLKQEESKKQRDLHWMKCPKCGSDMVQKDISGVKIDECTRCEGIYLDRGELEELMLKKDDERKSIMRRITGLFRP